MIPRNRELILRFIRDCRLGKTLRQRQKKVIGDARCTKYMQILRKLSSWLNKPFDQVTQQDMEAFIEKLENDEYMAEIMGKNGQILKHKKLAHSTKVGYKITLKKFYKWLFGNSQHYPELVDWIETYDIVKEVTALRREEIEKIVTASKLRDKAIIMFLFDSGARVEELLNIRLCDISKNGDTYKVRIVHSKTKPRTIHLPICSLHLELWLQENSEKEEQAFLFPMSYGSLRMMLHRIGKKVLNKNVNPHLLRHSSATYYAGLLKNPYKLCYRYGWTMASKQPNRYIDREGLMEEETVEIVKSNEISGLQRENQLLKEKISVLSEDISSFKSQNDNLSEYTRGIRSRNYGEKDSKHFMILLLSLAKQQREMSKALENLTGKKFDFVLPLQD